MYMDKDFNLSEKQDGRFDTFVQNVTSYFFKTFHVCRESDRDYARIRKEANKFNLEANYFK